MILEVYPAASAVTGRSQPIEVLRDVLDALDDDSGAAAARSKSLEKLLLYQMQKKQEWVAVVLNVFLPGIGFCCCDKFILGLISLPICGAIIAVSHGIAWIIIAPIMALLGSSAVDSFNTKLEKSLQ